MKISLRRPSAGLASMKMVSSNGGRTQDLPTSFSLPSAPGDDGGMAMRTSVLYAGRLSSELEADVDGAAVVAMAGLRRGDGG